MNIKIRSSIRKNKIESERATLEVRVVQVTRAKLVMEARVVESVTIEVTLVLVEAIPLKITIHQVLKIFPSSKPT